MSFLPNFKGDVFISYAHIDNQPLEGQQGWIDNFHLILQRSLAVELGTAKITIWRDKKLCGNDAFNDEIKDQVSSVAVLITVLSRSFINSDYCKLELDLFQRGAERTGGIQIANKLRIFRVEKEDIQEESFPPLLKGTDGYEFTYTDENDRPRGLSLDVDRCKFCLKVQDVARDISQLLETLKVVNDKPDLTSPYQPVAPSGITIYLAETTSDLREQYENIKRELEACGHRVLPDKQLPMQNVSEFCEAVRRDLSCSHLSIHLIGAKSAVVPEEAEDKSIVCLQNELAADYGQQNNLLRMIWIPTGTEAKAKPRQQKYIEYLRTDSTIQQGADFIEEPLENFKTIIQDKLRYLIDSQQKSTEDPNEDSLLRVYLICDEPDFAAIKPLKSYLHDQGFAVIKPVKDNDQNHRDNLTACDVVIIYYGKDTDPEDDSWLDLKLAELRKLSDYNRKKPMLAQAIYLGSQETEGKRAYRSREVLVIRDFGKLATEHFKEFLTQIEMAKRGRS